MPWYNWLDSKLKPYGKGMDIILLLLAAGCISMIFAPASLKAGFIVYMLSP